MSSPELVSVVHTLQTSSQKPLGQLKPNFIWSHYGLGERKFVQNGPENMTKMAAMPTYGKNYLKIFFSATNRARALKLSMQNWGFNFNKRDVIHVSKRFCCFCFPNLN